MKLTTLICLSFFLSATQIFNAQEIAWGSTIESDGFKDRFYPCSDGGYLLTYDEIIKYKSTEIVGRTKFISKMSNGYPAIKGGAVANDKFVLIYSSESDDKKNTYYQLYDEQCIPVGSEVLVGQSVVDPVASPRRLNEVAVINSKNGSFFGIEYCCPALNSEDPTFGYKIYNLDLEVITEGNFKLPFSMHQTVIAKQYLSDQGDLHLITKTYNEISETINLRQTRIYSKLSIHKVNDNSLYSFELNDSKFELKDKNLTDLSIAIDKNNIVTCYAVFIAGEKYEKFKRGFCFISFDFETGEKINEQYKMYESTVVAKDPIVGEFNYRHVFKEIDVLDGGKVVLIEQSESRSESSYKGNIIACRINPSGAIDWISIIPKIQSNGNSSESSLLSYNSFYNESKITILFNDDRGNYSENGEYLVPKKGFETAYFDNLVKNNCIVKVELDVNSGAAVRSTFNNPSFSEFLLSPVHFQANSENSKIIISGSSINEKNEKTGLFQLK